MIIPYQIQYYNITKRLLDEPNKIGNSRIGKINSRFVEQLRINLKKEFPLQDIKKIKPSNIIHELIWMIRGDTNIKYLVENGCKIWTDDSFRYFNEKYSIYTEKEISKEIFIEKVLAEEKIDIPASRGHIYTYGDLDRVYGKQWRGFNSKTDQLKNCINTLKINPDDRRIIVTAHNPTDIEENNVGLASCHNYFQFYTTINEDGSRDLSTFVNIRSNDWFLGQPYNMAQYGMLTHIIAKIVGMGVGELVINSVDAHLYHAHFDAAKIWLNRFEKICDDNYIYEQGLDVDYFKLFGCKAKIEFTIDFTIDDITADDIKITNYEPQGFIKAPLLT